MTRKDVHLRLDPALLRRARGQLKTPDMEIHGSFTQLVEVALKEKLDRSRTSGDSETTEAG